MAGWAGLGRAEAVGRLVERRIRAGSGVECNGSAVSDSREESGLLRRSSSAG